MKRFTVVLMLLPGFLLAQFPQIRCGHSIFSEALSPNQEHFSPVAFDMKYLFLDLEANNLNTVINGNATLLVEVVTEHLQSFELELSDYLVVSRVELNGESTQFTHANNLLIIDANKPFKNGDLVSVKTYYGGEANPDAVNASGIFSRASGSWDNHITWTLSEPFDAFTWWPAKQSLTDKLDSSRVHITTDSHLKAASNGILTNTVTSNGKVRHEWKSSYPIAYYLIAFCVGEYIEYVNYAKPTFMEGDSLMIQNYLYNNPQTLPYFQEHLDLIPEMVEFFSEIFGPYPFSTEKYGHMMAPFSGGMEHQTMSTMGIFTFGLDAHELAHQWFGNQVTCATWGDIWINEGFARFSEYLAAEKLLNKNNAQDVINTDIRSVLSLDTGSVYVPENQRTDPRIFNYQLTYQKGGLLLHMIRNILKDDERFFLVLKTFQERYKHQTATGDDFRSVLEELTAVSFADFFDQWYYGEGYPIFDIQWSKFPTDSLTISIQQSTTGLTPLFTTPLEFLIEYQSGVIKRVIIQQSELNETFRFAANGNVRKVSFDKNNWLIKKVNSYVQLDSQGNPILRLSRSKDLSIYPNPAQNYFQVEGNVNQVKIYDLLGNVVLQQNQLNPDQKIAVSNLPSGIYYVTTDINSKPIKLLIKN